jgi:NAD(P)H-quinone oxidoreductase subunit 4L
MMLMAIFTLSLQHFLVLSAVLFCIGLFGVLTQRNVIKIIMCLEIMLNAVNIALIAFSQYIVPTALTGQIFAIFVMVVAAAEVAVGIAIIFSVYRNRESVDIENFDLLRW